MKDQIKVYTSASAIRRPFALLKNLFADLVNSRELAWRITVRDFKARTRQSILGIFGVLLFPLLTSLIWLLLRNQGIVSIGETSIPYPVFVFTGTIIWSIFVESIQLPLQKLTSNRAILSKMNFPREALVISAFFQCFSNTAVKVLILVVGMIFLDFNFFSSYFLLFPLAFVCLIISGMAIGVLLIPFGMLYTDVAKLLPVLMQFLMFFTPVIYPIVPKNELTSIFTYNPASILISTCRELVTGNAPEMLSSYLQVVVAMLGVFAFAFIFFRISMPIIIERLSV